eukprot:4259975-Prymnesium_polylepis.1
MGMSEKRRSRSGAREPRARVRRRKRARRVWWRGPRLFGEVTLRPGPREIPLHVQWRRTRPSWSRCG